MINVDKLLFWLDKRYNVLFEGRHGVGKSSIVFAAFKKANIKYAYFSGSTMDPFIDFCGVPIKVDMEDGEHAIELIRPKHLLNKDIEAIFIDELNRSHKKIRNAVMELIQFGTINGDKVFPNLKVVWAAVNPDSADGEGEYDTDRLDPAQRDRFHIQVEIPYECDYKYFMEKYGEDDAKAAIDWWKDLPTETKNKVSPRRLDYAISVYRDGGDLGDVIPNISNRNKLISNLTVGPIDKKLESLIGHPNDAKIFLSNENSYTYAKKCLISNPKFTSAFLHLLPKEKIVTLWVEEPKVKLFIKNDMKNKLNDSYYTKILLEVAKANQNDSLSNEIKKDLKNVGIDIIPLEIHVAYKEQEGGKSNHQVLEDLLSTEPVQTHDRKKMYNKLKEEVYSTINADEAKDILKIINTISSSSTNTIKKEMEDLHKYGNYAILKMFENNLKYDYVNDFVNNLKKLVKSRADMYYPTVEDIYNYHVNNTSAVLKTNQPVFSTKNDKKSKELEVKIETDSLPLPQ